MVEWNDSKKYGAIFGGAFVLAGLVLSIIVFPFWNLIRDDVYEKVVILSNNGGTLASTVLADDLLAIVA